MNAQQGIRLALMMLLFIPSAWASDGDGTFEPIFNGRDLTGWQGDPEIWTVQEGAITARTTADNPLKSNTFLVWQGGDVGDFELELEYRIVGGNSGIQYRSRLIDSAAWIVGGYQADIEDGDTYSGILFEERGRGILARRGQLVELNSQGKKCEITVASSADLQAKILKQDWNRFKVQAQGEMLHHYINGNLMCRTRDAETGHRAGVGILALQAHVGPPMTVQFRDIRLKRLASSEVAETAVEIDETTSVSTPLDAITVLPGFQVEMVHSVPSDTQGSWVSMTAGPGGSLITADQYGDLYRVLPSAAGADPASTIVERLNVPIGRAHGMLWNEDSLYVMANGELQPEGMRLSGLFRIRDTDGDGHLDTGRLLKKISGGSEHGPHAVVLGPGGNDIYVVAGNHTPPIEFDTSLVPRVWDEDQLLPRMWDAGGHAVGIMAPGGWIARTDLEGKSWELVSIGFRNPYDIAFDKHGELFTYDSDMEWDIGTPWYRPTRLCHVTGGSEFGWRSGTGKWPSGYTDSLPAVVDIGPGCPTGITFGYGARFPVKYQNALFLCDWSFGKLYAVHLSPSGASYAGEVEDFITGVPLPLTDVLIHPDDGAMYFTIGGRETQSGLYRVRVDGKETIAKQRTDDGSVSKTERARHKIVELRRRFDQGPGSQGPVSLDEAWSYLGHTDRHLRYAARMAVESKPVSTWQARALAESNPVAAVEASIALARHGDREDSQLSRDLYRNLAAVEWNKLSKVRQIGLLRACGLAAIRLAPVDDATRLAVAQRFDVQFPNPETELNQELCRLLAYLDSPQVVEKTLLLLRNALSQEEQIHYALCLRNVIAGATPDQQREYFRWFRNTGDIRGGYSLKKFIDNIKQEAVGQLDDEQKNLLAEVLEPVVEQDAIEETPREVVKDYSVSDVVGLVNNGLHGRNFERGRQLFATAQCVKCHRVGTEGGATGPDLTTVSRRFSARDLAEAMVNPSKVISDRYRATIFQLDDGRTVTGRVANLNLDRIMVVTDMAAPGDMTAVKRSEIEFMQTSKVSVMPEGLLDFLQEGELADLLAFLQSGGDPQNKVFASN